MLNEVPSHATEPPVYSVCPTAGHVSSLLAHLEGICTYYSPWAFKVSVDGLQQIILWYLIISANIDCCIFCCMVFKCWLHLAKILEIRRSINISHQHFFKSWIFVINVKPLKMSLWAWNVSGCWKDWIERILSCIWWYMVKWEVLRYVWITERR